MTDHTQNITDLNAAKARIKRATSDMNAADGLITRVIEQLKTPEPPPAPEIRIVEPLEGWKDGVVVELVNTYVNADTWASVYNKDTEATDTLSPVLQDGAWSVVLNTTAERGVLTVTAVERGTNAQLDKTSTGVIEIKQPGNPVPGPPPQTPSEDIKLAAGVMIQEPGMKVRSVTWEGNDFSDLFLSGLDFGSVVFAPPDRSTADRVSLIDLRWDGATNSTANAGNASPTAEGVIGISVQDWRNLAILRPVITNGAWSEQRDEPRLAGIYLDGVNGCVISGGVIAWQGTKRHRTMFSHGVYAKEGATRITLEQMLFYACSSHGFQLRGGGNAGGCISARCNNGGFTANGRFDGCLVMDGEPIGEPAGRQIETSVGLSTRREDGAIAYAKDCTVVRQGMSAPGKDWGGAYHAEDGTTIQLERGNRVGGWTATSGNVRGQAIAPITPDAVGTLTDQDVLDLVANGIDAGTIHNLRSELLA